MLHTHKCTPLQKTSRRLPQGAKSQNHVAELRGVATPSLTQHDTQKTRVCANTHRQTNTHTGTDTYTQKHAYTTNTGTYLTCKL